MSEQSLKCAIFLSIIKEIPWEWNLRRKFLALVAAATAALKHQSGKAERRMIFRCQNLRWRTNTRLRILHPHDQFKSLSECGVWSCVLYWQNTEKISFRNLKKMYIQKSDEIFYSQFHYYISSNKKGFVFKFLPS